MNTLVNDKVISSFFNDDNFNTELKAMLNKTIDEELSKEPDDMDCDLIDECVQTLIEIEQSSNDGFAALISLLSSKKIISACEKDRFKNLNKSIKASLIACIILISAMTANAAVAKIFNYNIAQEVVNTISEKLKDWGIVASANDNGEIVIDEIPAASENSQVDESKKEAKLNKNEDKEETKLNNNTDTKKVNAKAYTENNDKKVISAIAENNTKPVALRLTFSDSFKTEYLWGESLDTSGLAVTAVYDGGTTKEIDIKDCSFTGYNKVTEGTQKIVVTYEGTSATFEITLKKTTQNTEKVITNIIGKAPDKIAYTTNDKFINLAGLEIRATYSDGSFSRVYTDKDAVIVSDIDLSTEGEKTVTLKIDNSFDYTYDIIVYKSVEEVEIESIRPYPFTNYTFYLGEDVDLSEFSIRVTYKDKTKEKTKNDIVHYNSNFIITGIDTSTQTLGINRTLTIYYKGAVCSAPYEVKAKSTVAYTSFNSDERPKFLYYYGEPLSIGKDYAIDEIENLKSSQQMVDGSDKYWDLFDGYFWGLQVWWNDTSVTTDGRLYYHTDCDFYGYDPYKYGYQTIDTFIDGVYVMSFSVFVYGDEGFAPLRRPEMNVRVGSEQNDLRTGKWAACTGDAGLSINEALRRYAENYDESKKHIYNNTPECKFINGITSYATLDNEDEIGIQTATITLPDGTIYKYDVYHVYNVKSYKIKNPVPYYKLSVEDAKNNNFGDMSLEITTKDGQLLNESIENSNVNYQVTKELDLNNINSVFAGAHISLDRTKYYFDGRNFAYIPLYIYSEGYENTISMEIVNRGLQSENREIFTVGAFNDRDITDFYYTIRLHAFDNYVDVQSDYIILSGIDFNTVGKYNVGFSVELNGETYTLYKTLYIADPVPDRGLKIVTDPNTGHKFMPGDTVDINGISLTYKNRLGETTKLTADDITYEITYGGKGHTIDSELNTSYITITYKYVDNWEEEFTCTAQYSTWGYMPYFNSYYFSKEKNAVVVNWNKVDDADYYIVTFLGESYITSDTYVYCDRNLRNDTFSKERVTIKPVKVVDGKKLIGYGANFCYLYFTIDGYVPPEE